MELNRSGVGVIELQRILSGFLACMLGFERSIWLLSKLVRCLNSILVVGGGEVRGKGR
jgi:hypothetical protein